jgi:hypothetical protein
MEAWEIVLLIIGIVLVIAAFVVFMMYLNRGELPYNPEIVYMVAPRHDPEPEIVYKIEPLREVQGNSYEIENRQIFKTQRREAQVLLERQRLHELEQRKQRNLIAIEQETQRIREEMKSRQQRRPLSTNEAEAEQIRLSNEKLYQRNSNLDANFVKAQKSAQNIRSKTKRANKERVKQSQAKVPWSQPMPKFDEFRREFQ